MNDDTKLLAWFSGRDTRPKLKGWAPGFYERICNDCKEKFLGDKRAIQCAKCAYEGMKKMYTVKCEELKEERKFNEFENAHEFAIDSSKITGKTYIVDGPGTFEIITHRESKNEKV